MGRVRLVRAGGEEDGEGRLDAVIGVQDGVLGMTGPHGDPSPILTTVPCHLRNTDSRI